jgi:hypothetical protein
VPATPQVVVDRAPLNRDEAARDLAREITSSATCATPRRERKKVAMLFAHLKRILKLDRLRLRGPCSAKDEFHPAATAQNLLGLESAMISAPITGGARETAAWFQVSFGGRSRRKLRARTRPFRVWRFTAPRQIRCVQR